MPASPPPPGPAAPLPITLTWKAPEGCASDAEVLGRVAALLSPGASDPARALSVDASVVASADGFALSMTITSHDDKRAVRKLSGATCDTVRDAAALVIALAFDPSRVRLGEPTPEPAPPPDPPVKPPDPQPPQRTPDPPRAAPPPAVPAPAPPPRPARKSPAQLGAGLDFVLDVGALPGLTPGLTAELALAIDAWRIAPFFLVFPSSRATFQDAGAGDVEEGAVFSLLGGGLRGCRNVLPFSARETTEAGDPTLLGCVAVELGEMRADGFGVSRPNETASLWAAGELEARFELAITGPLALRLGAGLVVPFNPLNFVIDKPGADAIVHTPSPVSGRFGGGIAALF